MRTGDWNISYRDQQGKVSQRRITILGYETNRYGSCMVKAFCHLRHEERTFNLSRVISWSQAAASSTIHDSNYGAMSATPSTVYQWQAPVLEKVESAQYPARAFSTASVIERPPALTKVQPQTVAVASATTGKARVSDDPTHFQAKFYVICALVILTPILLVSMNRTGSQDVAKSATAKVAVYSPSPTIKPAATTKPKPVIKPSPKPVPKPSPSGDLSTWTDSQLETEYNRLNGIIDREMDVWLKETDALGYDFRDTEIMRQRNQSFARYQSRTAEVRQAWMAIIHEQTNRMMADYRRERAQQDEAARSNQQEVVLRKQPAPEPQLTAKQKRDAEFTQVSGNRSPVVMELYARADANDNGQLDWDEIQAFQRQLYANYRYQSNDSALKPDQFVAQGGGDCEDWAIMTVGMLQYWGIRAYVGCFQNPSDTSMNHAISLVPVDSVPTNMNAIPLHGWTEFHTQRSIPDGQYVPIDYIAVGGITNAMGSDWNMTYLVEATMMYGERW